MVAFALVTATPALAILGHGPVWTATYVAAFQPQFGTAGVPYSGILKLKFNHNYISGTYDSTSVRPDPMYGRIINVTGTVSKGNVILHIASLTMLNGTIDTLGTISGTASWQGRLFNFLAKVKSSP
ncbi:MAG: hypothetical protein JO092_00525 [Candidatus Eremiobacteraeota bacterium]|nr:hypothetical protein [Candidatus Eremiobacteraeota bacterium]MBV8374111.1 hypothetical protein [Candidatus Eremiobacteraeota bacterium]